jgi:hypothetical protein
MYDEMVITEARKRANEKWRKNHLEYFNAYQKKKYANDPTYRERCKAYVKNSREFRKEASRMMAIEV